MKRTAIVSLVVVFVVPAACGGGGGSSGSDAWDPGQAPSGPVSAQQDELAEDAFWQQAADDSEMSFLKEAMAKAGFTTFVNAGVLAEEGGARLDFAAYASPSGEERAVVRHCKAGDCVRAIAHIEGEEIRWADSAGADVPVRSVAIPPLLRQAKSQKLEEGTVIVPLQSALANDPDPIDPGSIDLSRRRLVFASQFGPESGLAVGDAVGALASSGLFTEVVADNHATWTAIQEYLSSSYPQEVLVLAGQAIRKLYKDSKDPEKRWYRTVGIAVSSGLYGFTIATADNLGSAHDRAPFSGPGVILLLGSESLGDESSGMKTDESIPSHFKVSGQVVAGFLHQAAPAVILAASKDFLEALGKGATVAEARDSVNKRLEAWGQKARLAFAGEPDEKARLLPNPTSFWGDKPPKTADAAMYVHLRPWCAPVPGKTEVAEDEKQANPGFKDMDVDGPVFKGQHEIEITPGVFLKTEVMGVLSELRAGAHFYFVLKGDLKPEFKGVTLYCNAEIIEIVEDGDRKRIRFKGGAKAPFKFTNPQGLTCSLRDTDLEPMLEGTGVSEIVLNY